VAIDVARIFSKKIDHLQSTDINDKTLELKRTCPTENVLNPFLKVLKGRIDNYCGKKRLYTSCFHNQRIERNNEDGRCGSLLNEE